MPDQPIDLTIIYTEGDLVKLEFWRGDERLLWVDLTRDKARDWAAKLSGAADTYSAAGIE